MYMYIETCYISILLWIFQYTYIYFLTFKNEVVFVHRRDANHHPSDLKTNTLNIAKNFRLQQQNSIWGLYATILLCLCFFKNSLYNFCSCLMLLLILINIFEFSPFLSLESISFFFSCSFLWKTMIFSCLTWQIRNSFRKWNCKIFFIWATNITKSDLHF